MNAEDHPQPPAATEPVEPTEPTEPIEPTETREERPPKPGRALAGLALLIALAALAGSAWLWWSDFSDRGAATARQAADASRIDQLESDIGEQLRDVRSRLDRLAAEDAGDVQAVKRQVRDLQSELRQAEQARSANAALARTLQSSLESTGARLAALQSRFDALAARGIDADAELDLAELDFLLRLAQERLRLFLDIRSADRALELAAEHVAALDNPVYSGLRREIAEARNALAAVDMPEPATLDRELDAVQQRIATMPFAGDEVLGADRPAGAAVEGEGWWERLKSTLSGLVTVRRTTEEAENLPALADQELIRQRAWLEVERVRLAAMRHDQSAYEAAIDRARETIARWFAPQHRGTRAALQALESAAELDVEPELPDISGPLVALRALRVNERGAAPSPAYPSSRDRMPPAAEAEPAAAGDVSGESEENAENGDSTAEPATGSEAAQAEDSA